MIGTINSANRFRTLRAFEPPAGMWSPAVLARNSKLVQWQPQFEYEPLTYGGRSVLKDFARVGTAREPRQQRVYLFDGTNDYAVSAAQVTSGSNFTVSAIVIPVSVTGTTCIACEYGTNFRWIVANDTGKIRVQVYTVGSTNYRVDTDSVVLVNGTPAHVAVTLSGSTVTIYINGAVVPSTLISGTPAAISSSSEPLRLGSLGGTTWYYSGKMKDARVYSTAKSAAEILAIYNQAATPTTFDTTGLLAHYACEEESGPIAYDSSGNGKHLTITNASTLPGGTFHATDSTLPHSMANEYGGSYGKTVMRNVAGTFNGGWLSSQSLTGDGYVEFIIDANSANHIVGLTSDTTFTASNNYAIVDFGIIATGVLKYENNATAGTGGTFAIGDVVRFTRTGTTVTATKNGAAFTTFGTTSSATLYAFMTSNLSTETQTCSSFNGAEPISGNTQSVAVYTRPIPRSLSTPANDVLGRTAHYIGQVPHYATVDPPCIAGDGTAVYADLGAALIPASADFALELWYYHPTNDTTVRTIWSQATSAASAGRTWLLANASSGIGTAGSINLLAAGTVSVQLNLTNALTASQWHKITVQRVTDTFTVTIECPAVKTRVVGVATGTGITLHTARNTWLLREVSGADNYADGRVSSFSLNSGGVTRTFALQEGKGTDESNRTLYGFDSAGNALTSGTLVNGTVATIWGATCAFARDFAVNDGAYVNANNVCIPAISTTLAADGSALNRSAGKHSNPWSKLNRNPFSSAGLNGAVADTGVDAGENVQDDSPVDSGYRRTKTAGDDRYFIAGTRSGYTLTGLTGSDKTNAEAYVA